MQARRLLLDPAIHEEFTRLKMPRGRGRRGSIGGRAYSSAPPVFTPPHSPPYSDSLSQPPIGTATLSTSAAVSSSDSSLSVIHIENEMLIPSHDCSARMKKIFETTIHPDGYNWKNVPDGYRQTYFEEFKKYYTWDESIENGVYVVWLKQAATWYADMVYMWKKNMDQVRPSCVPNEIWRRWLQHWDTPDVRMRSEQQSKNSLTEVGGPSTSPSHYTEGSRTFIEHSHVLVKHADQNPNAYELLKHIRTTKDGLFINEQSRKIDTCATAAIQLVEDSSKPPIVDMSQLYVDVVGEKKKQHIYSLDTKASVFIPCRVNTNSSGTSISNQDILRIQIREDVQAEIHAEMQAMQVEMQVQMQAKMQAQIDAQMQAMQALQAQMEACMQQVKQYALITPPVQPPNETSPLDRGVGDVRDIDLEI